jgi:zinc transporter ZupT
LFDGCLSLSFFLAVGALIGDAFIHIIPELFAEASETDQVTSSMLILTGFLASFILERAIGHHHHARFAFTGLHTQLFFTSIEKK